MFLDDIEIKHAIEAAPGTEGFVVVNPDDDYDKVHYCRKCSTRICTAVLRGRVKVRVGGEVYV